MIKFQDQLRQIAETKGAALRESAQEQISESGV
jgi:hypothetical protein